MTALLTIDRVAEILNVPKDRAYDLARQNVIPVVRLGRQVRVHPDRLGEWINGGGTALPGGWKRES